MPKISIEFPLQFRPVDDQMNERMKQMFASMLNGYQIVETQPGNFRMPSPFDQMAPDYYAMQLREDDVWIVTFPKCGTTWTVEMVWLLMNQFNTQKAKEVSQEHRVPFLEMGSLVNDEVKAYVKKFIDDKPDIVEAYADALPLDRINQLPSPRCIKTHLPFYLLPPKLLDTCKVVYVARNPKDVIVSFYYHHLLIPNVQLNANFAQFARAFMRDEVMFAPFWPHLFEAWRLRHHPNLLFLFYEDMKADLPGQIEKTARFLDKKPTCDDVKRMTHHLSFNHMKQSGFVGKEKLQIVHDDQKMGFLRKGVVGDWKNHMGQDLEDEIDQWIERNNPQNELTFRYL